MFFICTYLDGDRWESGLEPLLYPIGMSFYRSFSYRRAHFHPEQLADQLSDSDQRNSLLKTNWNEGFFGVRFRSATHPEFLPAFVPLRRVQIASVDTSDQINISFKLGEFVRPETAAGAAAPLLPRMDLTGVLPDIQSTKLFIDVERAAASQWLTVDEFPPGMWEALEKTVSPAAKEKILHTVLLRLIRIRKRGESETVGSKEIDVKNHVWGLRLRENTPYDLTVGYFRIQESGSIAPAFEHQFLLTNLEGELQASRRYIQFNGNYRNEEMWIVPRIAGAGPIQISFEPCKLGDNKVVDPKTAKTIGLKIPVLVEKQKWPNIRLINLSIFLISIGVLPIIFRKYKNEVLLLVIAGLISLAVNAFKDVVLPKT